MTVTLAGLLGMTPVSVPAAEAAEDVPACPGGGYQTEFPCLGDLFVRDADGEIIDTTLNSLHIDSDARRLIAHTADDTVVEWGIDTPSGVPVQIGSPHEIDIQATDHDGHPLSSNITVAASVYDPASRLLFTGAWPEEGGEDACPLTGANSGDGCHDDPFRIVVQELDGARRTLIQELPERDLPDSPGFEGHKPRAFAFDAERQLLYVLTRLGSNEIGLPNSFKDTVSTVAARTTLHAYRLSHDTDELALEHRWNYSVDNCVDTIPGDSQGGTLGLGSSGDFVYIPCKGSGSASGSNLHPRLHAITVVDFELAEGEDPGELSSAQVEERFDVSQFPIAGDLTSSTVTLDPVHDRLYMLVSTAGPKRASVFDAGQRAWTGARPLADAKVGGIGVNVETGRAYITDEGDTGTGNVYLVDGAQVPAAQGPRISLGGSTLPDNLVRSVVDPVTRRLYLRKKGDGVIRVYEDRTDPFISQTEADPDDATHDIEESEAVSVTHTGEASAYGARFTAVSAQAGREVWRTAAVERTSLGGDRSASRATAVARGLVPSERGDQMARDLALTGGVPRAHRTGDGAFSVIQRELSNQAEQSAAVAQLVESLGPLFEGINDGRQQFREGDPSKPCDSGGEQLDQGHDRLFGRDPENPQEEPQPKDPDDPCGPREENPDSADNRYDDAAPGKERQRSRCADPGGPQKADEPGSAARCDGTAHELTAAAWMPHDTEWRPDDPAGSPFRVASSASGVHTERLDDGGLAVESHAVARGIDIGAPGAGGIHIGEIRSVARSEAHGRPGTAESTHTISINDVRIVDPDGNVAFACGWHTDRGDGSINTDEGENDESRADDPEGSCDPGAVMNALDEAGRFFAMPVRFEFAPRERDPEVVGSDGGARASTTKDTFRRANDIATLSDSSHEVPALKVTIFNEFSSGNSTQQETREVLDLAAVRTEALYQIGAAPSSGGDFEPGPSSLEIELADGSGSPLAGGHFEVRSPDGAPIRGGACTTAADGVGDCEFEPIEPGSYTVVQTGAPDGYVASSQPANVTVPVGGDTNVRFVNLAAIGTVRVTLVDAATGGPLAGGAFALYADDGDQTLGPGDSQVGSCTTGSDGSCGFGEVPLGAYVLHQAGAPQGYEAAGDLAFSLTRPGQEAGVRVVNGREAEASVGGVQLASSTPQGPTTTFGAGSSGGDGTFDVVRQTVGDAARFLVRNPGQAFLFGLFWLLVGAPAYLALRRRDLQLAKEIT